MLVFDYNSKPTLKSKSEAKQDSKKMKKSGKIWKNEKNGSMELWSQQKKSKNKKINICKKTAKDNTQQNQTKHTT